MLLTKTQSIDFNISVEPFSNILCEIRLAGNKTGVKLIIMACVYFKKSINIVDLITSNVEYIHSSKESKTHKIILSLPQFPKVITKSFVSINIDSSSSGNKIDIEDLIIKKIDENPIPNQINQTNENQLINTVRTNERDIDIIDLDKFLNNELKVDVSHLHNIENIYNLLKTDENKQKFLKFANL